MALIPSSLVTKTTLASRRFQAWSVRTLASEQPKPLFLWLGEGGSNTQNKLLLLPVPPPSKATVISPNDVLEEVNSHYTQSHFVGGMGEEDPGVFFASIGERDSLEYSDLVQEGISLAKEERHGIPFGLYTSGIVEGSSLPPLTELGLSTLQVSLFAGSPKEYAEATGRDEKSFGSVCSFIADAVEQGMAVECGVLEKYAGTARSLAVSLGAQEVHVFPK